MMSFAVTLFYNGATRYVSNVKFDKDTDVISNGSELSINEEKIKEVAKYDRYYSIVTSEENLNVLS